MAEIKVAADSFYLNSTWKVEVVISTPTITSSPTTAYKTVTFNYKVPKGATIKSAKVHSTWSYPTSGFSTQTVNGKTPTSSNGYMVDVEIDPESTSVSVTFAFKAKGSTDTVGTITATTAVSDVYLLIEYSGGVSCIYHAENGKLVPYQLYRAEGGVLVPYQLQHAEDGVLVPYG